MYGAQYVRDNLGRITQKVEVIKGIANTYAYSYDTAGRLITVSKNNVVTNNYSYDSNGNRLNNSATYDAQDRLLSYGGNTYAYTANGELQSKVNASGTTQYVYDVMGNLLSASIQPSSGANPLTIEYIIDAQNRKIGKKVNGVLVQGWLYENQLNPIAELDGAGNVVSRFVYGTKSNVPDYMIKGGIMYRIISDNLGSPVLIVDASSGVVAQQMSYDEYGNVLSDSNPGFQPFGYAGGLYDRDTGLVRFGARDYDAESGRWTVKDPIRFMGKSTNLYGYVLSDPVNLIDPEGLEAGGSVMISWSGTIGGLPFVGPGIFIGGGTGVGVNTSGQLFIQVQANVMSGIGLFAGIGTQISISNQCRTETGSTDLSSHNEINAGMGTKGGGGSLDINKQSVTGGFSLRGGRNYGAMAATGVSTSTTIVLFDFMPEAY